MDKYLCMLISIKYCITCKSLHSMLCDLLHEYVRERFPKATIIMDVHVTLNLMLLLRIRDK